MGEVWRGVVDAAAALGGGGGQHGGQHSGPGAPERRVLAEDQDRDFACRGCGAQVDM
jgi:hypothetical protein